MDIIYWLIGLAVIAGVVILVRKGKQTNASGSGGGSGPTTRRK